MSERGPHGEDEAQVDSGNVVHIEVSETDVARGEIVSLPKFSMYCSSTDHQDWSAFSNTWSIVQTVKWEQNKSDNLLAEGFPVYAVDKLSTYPQMMPFKMYQYWRGDIEFRFTIAGSPFAIGQCQCAWYYDAENDATYTDLRDNKWARSQMLHALLDAAPSNDVLLYIPYRAYRSYLPTRDKRAEQGKRANLGMLTIAPLNKLRVPNGCTGTVNIVVHVRFPNSIFQGRIATDY